MLAKLRRAAPFAALLLAVVGCSQPPASTAPVYTIPEPPPPDPAAVAKEAAYREHLDAGRKALDAKDFDTAVASFERAATANPKGFEAHLGLGHACVAKNDHAKAIQAFGAALDLNPLLGEVSLERAALLERAGRLKEARAEYDRLIAQEVTRPLTAKGYWLRAGVADRLGDRAGYRDDRERAMALDSTYETKVTAGDVRVFNHTEGRFFLMLDWVVNPDGTERTFPAGFTFTIPGDNSVYLRDKEQKFIPARSLGFTIRRDVKTKSFTATYEKGATLEVHIYDTDLPK